MNRLLTTFVAFAIAFFAFAFYFSIQTKAPVKSPVSDNYAFTINQGEGKGVITNNLVDDKVVTNKWYFLYTSAQFDTSSLQDGEYYLDVPATPKQLWSQIVDQSEKIEEERAENNLNSIREVVSVTIPEGKNIDQIINILDEKGIGNPERLRSIASSTTTFTQDDYDFLPTPKNCEYGNREDCIIYYLEGYLYPDTYEFFSNETDKAIISKFLNNFDQKVWQKSGINNADELFEKITLASVVEMESGRPLGVTADNIDKLTEERGVIAGIFNNRDEIGDLWRSDPTVTYGFQGQLCQQDREIKNCSFINEVPESKYSTYDNVGSPIGPITNPSWEVVNASLNPIDSEYLFFVSDLSGKAYFAITNEEHENNIQVTTEINKTIDTN